MGVAGGVDSGDEVDANSLVFSTWLLLAQFYPAVVCWVRSKISLSRLRWRPQRSSVRRRSGQATFRPPYPSRSRSCPTRRKRWGSCSMWGGAD